MTSLFCPSCHEIGELIEEDLARCDTPECRVTTFEITFPLVSL